jgi:hypothetical protein
VAKDPNRAAIERSLRGRIYALGFSSFLFFILLAFASARELISLRTEHITFFVYIALSSAAAGVTNRIAARPRRSSSKNSDAFEYSSTTPLQLKSEACRGL